MKANKKRQKKKNGLVKREAFPKESNPSKLRNVNKKKDRKKNAGRTKGKKKRRKGKKSRRRGKLRQGEITAYRMDQIVIWICQTQPKYQ